VYTVFAACILPQVKEFMAGWNFAMEFVLGLVAKDKIDWRMPERLRNMSDQVVDTARVGQVAGDSRCRH